MARHAGAEHVTHRATGFGVDIGGSGIKAAPVDLGRGELTADRSRIPTPQPATPEAVVEVVAELVRNAAWEQPFGLTFPGVVRDGITMTAANVDKSWIGVDIDALISERTGLDCHVLNDADAAGIAEVHFGAARDVVGTVLLLTFGTGIGSALFIDGLLVPNTELGHLEIEGLDAEVRAAASARERHGWSWKQWAAHVDTYLHVVEALLSPDLIVVGGGVSKQADKWLPRLTIETRAIPAELQNAAGIVGAALVGDGLIVDT